MDVSENNASHDSILLACADSFRPMSVRKVVASGTKGVGEGILVGFIDVCRFRFCGIGAAEQNVIGVRCV